MNTGPTQKTVTRIVTDSIERFIGEDRALFIAVLRKDIDLLENLRGLMEVAMEFGEEVLVACYTLEDLLPYFSERFGVGGTPTYLMIRNGQLLGSILGKNSQKTLVGFIHDHLDGQGGTKHPEAAPMGKTGVPAHGKKAAQGIR